MTSTPRGKQRNPNVFNEVARELKINPLSGTSPADKAFEISDARHRQVMRELRALGTE